MGKIPLAALKAAGIKREPDRRIFEHQPSRAPKTTPPHSRVLPGGWQLVERARINGTEIKAGDQFTSKIKSITANRKHAFVALHSSAGEFIFDGAIALESESTLLPGQPVTVKISRIRIRGEVGDLECQVDLEATPPTSTSPSQLGHRSKIAISFLLTASPQQLIEFATVILAVMRNKTIQIDDFCDTVRGFRFPDRETGVIHRNFNGEGENICDIYLFDPIVWDVLSEGSFYAELSPAIMGNTAGAKNCHLAMEGIGLESTPQDLIAAIQAGNVFDIVLAG